MSTKDARRLQDFNEYFQRIYGERWTSLSAAMHAHHDKVAVLNKYCTLPEEVVVGPAREDARTLVVCPIPSDVLRVFRTPDGSDVPLPPRDEHRILSYYILDLASTVPVVSLEIEPHHKVLDLCAAPGGKSVLIAQHLGPNGAVSSNEMNLERRQRLQRTFADYLPSSGLATVKTTVTQKDGTNWHQPAAFDRVLVDAPCSSERHLMQQHFADGIATWRTTTSSSMAKVQVVLLLRALETVNVGGIVVYSTCSISPLENDGVVAEALKRTRCGVEVLPPVTTLGDRTPDGHVLLLPDTCGGVGPMYVARLRRTALHRESPPTTSDDDDEDDDEAQ